MEYLEELIRKQPLEHIDWFWLAQSGNISESLIREYWDVIKSSKESVIFEETFHFSKDFMREFIDKIDWKHFVDYNRTWEHWRKIKIIKELKPDLWEIYRNEYTINEQC